MVEMNTSSNAMGAAPTVAGVPVDPRDVAHVAPGQVYVVEDQVRGTHVHQVYRGEVYEARVHREVLSDEREVFVVDVIGPDGAHLGTTHAAHLSALEGFVREVVVLGADLPDEVEDVVALRWVHEDVELAAAADVAADVLVLRARTAERVAALHDVVHRLSRAGYSVRDVAAVTGLSSARVSQVARSASVSP